MWVQSKHALDFFAVNNVPFQNMSNDNSRVSNGNWCLVDDSPTDPVVVVYLRNGGSAEIDLTGLGSSAGGGDPFSVQSGSVFSLHWFDPRNGGDLQSGSVLSLELAGFPQSLGNAPYDSDKDWVVLIDLL